MTEVSVASSAISMDKTSESALNQRIDFLKQEKPEVIFRNSKAQLDEYGFYVTYSPMKSQAQSLFPSEPECPNSARVEAKKEAKRIEQFTKYLELKNSCTHKQLKKLCRKGISEEHRGTIWKICLNVNQLMEKNEEANDSLYNRLLLEAIPEPVITQINKDIDRTMPELAFFNNSEELQSLFRILKAYAAYDLQTAYCEGMGFIAAVFLYYVDELSAFYCFLRYMSQNRDVYQETMIGTRRRCRLIISLLRETDESIFNYLSKIEFEDTAFSSWVMTLFFYSMDFAIAIRILDMYLCEGEKVIMRAAIALLRRCAKGQKIITKCAVGSEEEALEYSKLVEEKSFPNGISIIGMPACDLFMKINQVGFYVKNGDSFVKEMLAVKFKTQEMQNLYQKIVKLVK